MDAFVAIQSALRPFGLPCTPNRYTGKESRYIEYNYAVRSDGNFGDNRPDCNVASVQIHLFLPKKDDFRQLMNDIQAALADADFTWPSVRQIDEYDEIEAEDSGVRQPLDEVRHIVFECEYEETIN